MKTTRTILLTVALTALAISLVLMLGARLSRATENEIVTHFSQRQLLLAEQTALGLQFIFNEAQRDLMHLTGSPGPARLANALGAGDEEEITTWQKACAQGFSSYLHSHPFYTQLRYLDVDGQELMGVERDGERVRVIPQDQLRSQAERDFFIAAQQLHEGEVHISRLEPALGHGEVGAGQLTLRLITPVFDDQGRRAGSVVLNLLGEELRAYISRLSTEKNVDIWVLEETGVELINITHPELEGHNIYEYLRQTGDETLVALAEELLTGGRGTAIYLWPESGEEAPAVKKLVAYTPLYPAEGQMWSVGISVPYETILATHRQTRDTSLVSGGGIIAAILAGAFLIIRAERRRVEVEEQAHFRELLHRWNMQLQTATLVSRVASSILDMDRLIQQSVELIRERFDLYYAGLFLVDETGEWAVLRSGTGAAGRRMMEQGHKLKVGGNSMIGECVAHQQARITLDIGAEAARLAHPLLPETRSEMALPLISQGKAIGALTIQSAAAAAFSTEDIATLQTMADQLSNALEGTRRHEQAQRELAEREVLLHAQQDLGWALSAAQGLNAALKLCLETAIYVSGMDCGGIYLVDETSGDIELAFYKGLSPDFIKRAAHYAADLDNARLVRAGKPVYARYQELGISLDATSRDENLRAIAIIPIFHEDQVIACLNIASHTLDRVPDFARTALETITAQIGNVIVYQRTEEALQKSEEQYRDLVENINDVIYAIDASGILTYISPVVKSLSGYSSAELIGRPFAKLIHPEDLPGLLKVVQKVSLDHSSPYEYRIVTKSGAIRWVRSFSRQIFDGERMIGAQGALTDITTRVRVEKALREERDFAESLVNTAQVIILVLDVEGRIVRFNPYLESLSGYLLDEVQGQDWFNTFLPPQDHSRLRALFQKAVADTPTKGNVSLIVTRDGRERQIEWYDKTLKDAAGNIVGLLAIGQDITARMRAEENLKRYTRQLTALHAADLAIAAHLDLNTVLTQVLTEAQALLRAEVASVLLSDATGAELIFTAVVGIGSEALKGTHILADASIAGWVMREAQPVLSTDVQTDPRFYANIDAITGLTTRSLLAVPLLCQGRTLGVIEVINREHEEFNEHDLDLLSTLAGSAVIAIENARLYEETAHRLAKTQMLQEIMLASTLTLDFDQMLANILQAIHRTLHIEHLSFALPDETGEYMVVHSSLIGFIPPPGGNLHMSLDNCVVGRVYTTGQPELFDDTTEIPYYFDCTPEKMRSELAVPVKVNDHIVAVLNAESPHRGAFGEDDLRLFQAIAAQLGVVMENARLYEAEREQRKLAERSWSQLVQSEKLAATGRLAASLAHEINNPLQAIHNSLQLLLSFSLDTDEQREYLQMADEEIARLIGMVSRILDFARRPQQELRPTNVNDVIEKVLNLAGKYLQHRRIVLRRDLSPDLPVALAVPGELGQVFLNLVLNAVDTMPDGGTLHVASRLAADGRLTMTFSDTGQGISPEHLPHVFEPFFSTKEQGTGLGLFVSHNIVQRHGGEITMQSKVGTGTTFTVWLPVTRDVNGVSE